MKTVMTKLSLACLSLIIISLLFVAQSSAKISPESIVGAWLFDEGKGDVGKDSSGNGNDGKLVEGPEWVVGQFGKALKFDGQEARVDCGDVDALDFGTGDFTLAVWVNAAASGAGESGNGWSRILDKHYITGFSLMRSGGGPKVQFEVNGNAVTTITQNAVFDDNWHHIVAIRYDDTKSKIYIDGSLDVEGNLVGGNLFNDKPFRMGYDDPGFGGRMKCLMDEVAVFNVALIDEDIQQIMKQGLKTMLAVSPKEKLAQTWASIKVH
jgi:hypothetical protein